MGLCLKFMLTTFLLLVQGNAFSQDKVPRDLQSGDSPFPSMRPTMTEQSCGKVDLSKDLGPVHNQTAGTCYAFTALDLMNFGSSQRYSPLHLATLKALTPPPLQPAPLCPGVSAPVPDIFNFVGGFSGGDVAQAIRLGMSSGLCPEQLFPSTEGVLKKDYKKLLEYYQHLRVGEKTIVEICDPRSPKKLSDLLSTSGSTWTTRAVKREAKHMFPGIEEDKITELANSSISVDDFIKKLGQEACTAELQKNVPPGKTSTNVVSLSNLDTSNCRKRYFEENRAPMLALINKALDDQKPTGISYITGGLIQESNPRAHAYHASVVAGRSWSNGACNYLIKNSWGPDWRVRAGLKARSSTHPGYYVVTEKQLMEHLYGTTTID